MTLSLSDSSLLFALLHTTVTSLQAFVTGTEQLHLICLQELLFDWAIPTVNASLSRSCEQRMF